MFICLPIGTGRVVSVQVGIQEYFKWFIVFLILYSVIVFLICLPVGTGRVVLVQVCIQEYFKWFIVFLIVYYVVVFFIYVFP